MMLGGPAGLCATCCRGGSRCGACCVRHGNVWRFVWHCRSCDRRGSGGRNDFRCSRPRLLLRLQRRPPLRGAASTPAKAAAVTSATTAATAAVAADAAKVAPTAVDTAASAATASAVAADATPAVTAEVAAALPGVINLPAGNAAGRTSGTASSSTGGVSARPVSSLALIRTLAAPLQDAPAVQSDATTAPPEAEITFEG